MISLSDSFGWINELGARYVSVVTGDGRNYLIPNEDLITNQVVNWSHSDRFVRLELDFGNHLRQRPPQSPRNSDPDGESGGAGIEWSRS